MRRPINDEFTHLAISRQRKYQLRKRRENCCTECGEPAVRGSRCLKHLVKARERQRKKRGLKRRYYGTLSYKLQADSLTARSDLRGGEAGAGRSRLRGQGWKHPARKTAQCNGAGNKARRG